jgi:tetratricopeptide (TPR) repeat protein
MAIEYLAMGLYERAAAEVSRALSRGAPSGDGYSLLGDIYARQGAHGEALEQARRLAPLRADVHQRTGDISASVGDFDGAIAAYRHALELDQDFAVVRYQLAKLLRAKGHLREAEQELEAALDAVPTYAEATLELSSLRRSAGRIDDALDLLIAMLERDPYQFDALLALAETLLAIGRKRDAATAIRRILRFDPEHIGALYYEGVLLTDQKRFRDAIERWRMVIELAPSGDFARRARREARTAMDLDTIFSATAAAGV